MYPLHDRRKFLVGGAVTLGAACSMGLKPAIAEIPSLSEKRLIRFGLNALARAAQLDYFADGHRGAAIVSAHLMCDGNHFDDETAARIVELVDLNWSETKLCQDFPAADANANAVQAISAALTANSGQLREVGHDAIFAMHAIKAVQLVPEAATNERVTGICNLISAIKPWRDIAPSDDVQPPPFEDLQASSRYVLQEASDAIDRFHGFGQGFSGHMLTFGQAIVELASMGYVELAESCRTAFRKYVTVTRQGPQSTDRPIKDYQPTDLRPNELRYWQRRGDKSVSIGHVFKYPYAYYDLIRRAADPQLQEQLESKAWRIFG